jgi:hypothetical protein
MTSKTKDKTDKTDKTPVEVQNLIRQRFRAASPQGRLEAHEAALAAMRADGFDPGAFGLWVDHARAELDRGEVDRGRVHLAQADHALTMLDYIHDTDRLRGAKTLQGASDAGQARARETAPHRVDVMAEMERLLQVKDNVSWAAATAFKRGHGTSAEANRRLWNRHRQPKG